MIIIGKIIAISISKIKNKIAIKKNCKEKGVRAEDLGSNPHSKGDIFSRSKIVDLEMIVQIIINLNDTILAIINETINLNITFS